jgi:hypothetical protein
MSVIKSEELTNPSSCLNKAKDDEPMFVLLGRDPDAADTVRDWIGRRLASGMNTIGDGQLAEALTFSEVMRAYQPKRSPSKLPRREKHEATAITVLLIAAHLIDYSFTLADLTVVAWKLSPRQFCLRGYEQYPNSKTVMVAICRQNEKGGKGMIARGLFSILNMPGWNLEDVRRRHHEREYVITEEGTAIVEAFRDADPQRWNRMVGETLNWLRRNPIRRSEKV